MIFFFLTYMDAFLIEKTEFCPVLRGACRCFDNPLFQRLFISTNLSLCVDNVGFCQNIGLSKHRDNLDVPMVRQN